MKILLPLFFCLISLALFSQDCDGDRYINNIFSDITITSDIKYGEGNEINGNFRELFFDVYEPANDTETNRPVVILAFGGSFISGTRTDIDWLCEEYARKGYVAISIDYRLYDGPLFPLPTGVQMQEVVIKAVSDFRGAIRFLRHDADNGNTFNINPEIILVGGISAGSIAASHAAMLDSTDVFDEALTVIIEENEGLEGTTNDLFEYSSEAQGLINFSGGLAVANWIDSEDPPFYSVHDEFDDTVPYEGGFASVFGFDIIFMQGSKIMQEVADSVGLTNELVTIEGSEIHVSYFFPSVGEAAIANTIRLSSIYAEGVVCALSTSTEDESFSNISIFPNPTSGLVTIGGEQNTIYDVQVIDMTGRMVRSEKAVKEVDFSNLKDGLYSLKVIDTQGNLEVKQVVVKK